jgi:hypothetical protein
MSYARAGADPAILSSAIRAAITSVLTPSASALS